MEVPKPVKAVGRGIARGARKAYRATPEGVVQGTTRGTRVAVFAIRREIHTRRPSVRKATPPAVVEATVVEKAKKAVRKTAKKVVA